MDQGDLCSVLKFVLNDKWYSAKQCALWLDLTDLLDIALTHPLVLAHYDQELKPVMLQSIGGCGNWKENSATFWQYPNNLLSTVRLIGPLINLKQRRFEILDQITWSYRREDGEIPFAVSRFYVDRVMSLTGSRDYPPSLQQSKESAIRYHGKMAETMENKKWSSLMELLYQYYATKKLIKTTASWCKGGNGVRPIDSKRNKTICRLLQSRVSMSKKKLLGALAGVIKSVVNCGGKYFALQHLVVLLNDAKSGKDGKEAKYYKYLEKAIIYNREIEFAISDVVEGLYRKNARGKRRAVEICRKFTGVIEGLGWSLSRSIIQIEMQRSSKFHENAHLMKLLPSPSPQLGSEFWQFIGNRLRMGDLKTVYATVFYSQDSFFCSRSRDEMEYELGRLEGKKDLFSKLILYSLSSTGNPWNRAIQIESLLERLPRLLVNLQSIVSRYLWEVLKKNFHGFLDCLASLNAPRGFRFLGKHDEERSSYLKGLLEHFSEPYTGLNLCNHCGLSQRQCFLEKVDSLGIFPEYHTHSSLVNINRLTIDQNETIASGNVV